MKQSMIHLIWFYFVITMNRLFYSLAEMSVNLHTGFLKWLLFLFFFRCNFNILLLKFYMLKIVV